MTSPKPSRYSLLRSGAADWIIDLGPEGGAQGGYIVAQGTPEQVAEVEGSYTGQFLKRALAAD